MATAHVQSKGAIANNSTSLTVTMSGNFTAGNHIVTLNAVYHNASDPVQLLTTSAQGTFQNAIPQSHILNGSDWEAFRVDYCENIAGSGATVAINNTNASDVVAVVSESSGVATSSSKGTTNNNSTGSAGTTLTTGSISPTAGSILYAFTVPDKTAVDSAASTINTGGQGSNFTVTTTGGAGTNWDDSTNLPAGSGYFANCAATATNPTWTASTLCSKSQAAIIEFLAPGGAAQDTPELRVSTSRQMQQLLAQ